MLHHKKSILVIISIIILSTLLALKSQGATMFKLQSNSFANGAAIPDKYSCKGENISPHLQWQNSPTNVNSYLLIVDDPDAQRVIGRTFVHWTILLPKDNTQLTEGISGANKRSPIGIEFKNDFNRTYYGGPCPPKGNGKHTYRFSLFALSSSLEDAQEMIKTKAPLTAEEAKELFAPTIIGEANITGSYEIG